MTDEQSKFHVVPNDGPDAKREAIPRRLRFEIFKRDSFTCQYCGRKAPDVVLNCDHIHPVVDGGETTLLNLITSCAECNSGKGARKLDEQHVLQKARAGLEELNERRAQMEMLAEWHRELSAVEDMRITVLAHHWFELTEHQWEALSKHGEDHVRKWLRRFSPDELMAAMTAARTSYFRRDETGVFDEESTEHAFNMIPRIALVTRASADKPYLQTLFYIRGVLRRRFENLNERQAMNLMERAFDAGADLDWIELLAKQVSSWGRFRETLLDFLIEPPASGE